MDSLLASIHHPEQIKSMDLTQMKQLAEEIRALIIKTVACTGGHLASNLGMVELTMALLAVFNFEQDRIVFDVGHQSYTWKILTGRYEQFDTLRQQDGLSGFPKRSESPYDFFNTGHSSTSISAALGLVRAQERTGHGGHVLAVIGDGALTGGMSFEALNDAGQTAENLIVILNDNQMSISRNVGGLSNHLEKLRISPRYMRMKSSVEPILLKLPLIGPPLCRMLQNIKRLDRVWLRRQGIFFEQLGFRYYGPVDGHDLPGMIAHLKALRTIRGPILFHVLTQKGRGYAYAEAAPDIYHGVAPFVVEQGICFKEKDNGRPSFSEVFGQAMLQMAKQDPRVCAISAAMTAGTGLSDFAGQYPTRFFDVGIAEQHAVTMAAGLAAGGLRPVVALYSTFLQRAYDQILHDVCLQNLPVVIAIDRAGIVGEDGETHQGVYDLSLLLPLPAIEILCPDTDDALQASLSYGLASNHPVAIRYPRGKIAKKKLLYGEPAASQADTPTETFSADQEASPVDAAQHKTGAAGPDRYKPGPTGDTPASFYLNRYIHEPRKLRSGRQLTMIALGILSEAAAQAADLLALEGIDCDVYAVICAKPFDCQALLPSLKVTGHVLIVEDGVRQGGFGQSILPHLLQACPNLAFCLAAIDEMPLNQATRRQILSQQKLDAEGLVLQARDLLKTNQRQRT